MHDASRWTAIRLRHTRIDALACRKSSGPHEARVMMSETRADKVSRP